MWDDDSIKCLLGIWNSPDIYSQFDGTRRNGVVYTVITDRLKEHGFERTVAQVRTKMKNMRREYFQIRESMATNGTVDRKTWWPYYDDIEKIVNKIKPAGQNMSIYCRPNSCIDFGEDSDLTMNGDDADDDESVEAASSVIVNGNLSSSKEKRSEGTDINGPSTTHTHHILSAEPITLRPRKRKMSELLLNMDDAYNDLVTKRRKFQQPKYHNILVHRENLHEGFLRHESRTCVENAHHTTGKLDYCQEDEEAWLYFGPVKKSNDNLVTNITEKDRGMDVFLLAILFASQHNALESKYQPRFKTERVSNGIDGPSYSSLEVQEAANRWPTLPRRQLQRAMGDYELMEQESREFVDFQLLFWVASDDSFHDRRGKNFAKKVLEVLFSWHKDADIKMSTQGADQMLAIRGIVAPLPAANQLNGAGTMTHTHRIRNHLPITMETSLHDGKMSDLYVFDTKRGKVLLLGIVSNGGESLETRKIQLMEHMLLSWRPYQTMMFGVLFRPTCVYLVIFELDIQSRELRRSISPPLKYQKDGLRTVFESVLSSL
ncbi:uncharacterized protein LOC117117199 [Anneissia japonica]|uniref:uncharacterized protein LOC117117199 n=1 Tax=Anneissia japonica TaxID=1529436 RepID=UPI0014259B62|nr:uncharacterized protein LOC117117199 [Anneissia japonica]